MLPAISDALPRILELKYGPPDRQDRHPRLRAQYGYAVPSDLYEAFVFSLVTPNTRWLDVGSGRTPFPGNPQGARQLAERCALLVGIDPSDNIQANTFVHQRHQCLLEDFATDQQFDLITLRMVAEHITHPESTVATFARLVAPGGRVVMLTVNKWSPGSVVAAVTPMSVHHRAKKFLWNTREEDTFPVAYKMNTRRAPQEPLRTRRTEGGTVLLGRRLPVADVLRHTAEGRAYAAEMDARRRPAISRTVHPGLL